MTVTLIDERALKYLNQEEKSVKVPVMLPATEKKVMSFT